MALKSNTLYKIKESGLHVLPLAPVKISICGRRSWRMGVADGEFKGALMDVPIDAVEEVGSASERFVGLPFFNPKMMLAS